MAVFRSSDYQDRLPIRLGMASVAVPAPPPPPPPPPAPAVALTLSAPSTGTQNVASSALVSNTGTAARSWTMTAAPAGLTITPASGTLAAGQSTPVSLLSANIASFLLTLTDSLGVGVNGSPRTFSVEAAPPPPPSGATIATLQVTASGAGTFPYSATVLPLRGQVPAGSTLRSSGDSAARASILSTHDDGSAAVVVLAGSTTVTASQVKTLSVQTSTATAGTALTAADIDAVVTSVSVAFGSPYGTATLSDFTDPERIWWANEQTICARYHLPAPTPGSTSLEAVVDVQVWAGGRALVEGVIENCRLDSVTPVKPADAVYANAVVQVNGSTVATIPGTGITNTVTTTPVGSHEAFRSTYFKAWIGGDPGMRVAQVHTELQQHPLFFKMARGSSTSMAAYASDAYSPWQKGRHPSTDMGGVGDVPGIGPFPKWDCDFLQSGDARAAQACEASTLCVLGYSVNYRDAGTGLVPTFAQVVGKSQQSGWPRTVGPNGNGNRGGDMEWEVSHHPAAGLMAFAVRPSPVFIEVAQKVALWNGTRFNNRSGGPAYPVGVFGQGYQGRGRAWCMRSLAHATFLSPADSTTGAAWRAAAVQSLTDNVTWLSNWIGNPRAPLGMMFDDAWYDPVNATGGGATIFTTAAFFHHYFAMEVHKVASARLLTGAAQTAMNALADWACEQPVRYVTEQSGTGDPTIDGGWRYFAQKPPIWKSLNPADVNSNWGQQQKWVYYSPGPWIDRGVYPPSQPSGESGPLCSTLTNQTPLNYAEFSAVSGSALTYADFWWSAFVAAIERQVTGYAEAWNIVQQKVTNLSAYLDRFSADGRHGSYPKTAPPLAGFGSGTDAGSLVGQDWTPGVDGQGVVNAVSFNLVPTDRWTRVIGSRMDAVEPQIRAVFPAWNDIGSWFNLSESWGGTCTDRFSRVWWAGGGHGASTNNGIYRFDVFRMKWAIECMPTDVLREAYINNGAGSQTIIDQVVALRTGPGVPVENGITYDQWSDGKPVAKHWYDSLAYDPGLNRIFGRNRLLWSYNLTTGVWDYKRTQPQDPPAVGYWSDLGPTVDGFLPPYYRMTKWDLENSTGHFDQVAGEYITTSIGSASTGGQFTFKWADKSMVINTSPPWPVWTFKATTRYQNKIITIQQGSATRLPQYHVCDITTRATLVATTNMQLGGGLTLGEFQIADQAYSASLVYVPPLNRYWFVQTESAVFNRMAWFEIDPTTTPWTISRKTWPGTVPIPHWVMGTKMNWLPGAGVVHLLDRCNAENWIFKV